jgi:hypothetical protein
MKGRSVIVPTLVAVFGSLAVVLSPAQERSQFSYKVGRKPVVSVRNQYGPTMVGRSEQGRVVATAVSHSATGSFVHKQHGNRIELRAISPTQGSDLVEYTILVPKDAIVILESFNGKLRVQGLQGDVIVQAVGAPVEISEMTGAHINLKTLSGPISLTSARGCRVAIQSVSGDVKLDHVADSSVAAHSGGGRITYDGDPGSAGDYKLSTHSGNIEVSIPANTLVRVDGRTLRGQFAQEPANSGCISPPGRANLLAQPRTSDAPVFVLRSFRGQILVRRP